MTTYFKQLNDSGEVVFLLTYDNFCPNIANTLIVEITQEEYNVLLAKLQAKAEETEQVNSDEISDEEALDIILGVSE